MEKKVFRLHGGNKDTGWFRSIKPDFSKVNTDGKKIATSIPSPFAQIDLVKSAFKWVADNGIDGKTAQHKLVSDALDIGQIFFISNRIKNKIDILSWDPEMRLTDLLNSTNKNHTDLAKTLSVFWEQDGEIYNFNKVNRLYFIINKQGELLGGTSPATLFFAAPDAQKYCPEIHCGPDVLLDKFFFSLADREQSFIEYIFALSSYPGFAGLFPEVYSYLQAVRRQLPDFLQIKINNQSNSAFQQYNTCSVSNNPNDCCEVLNIALGTEPEMKNVIKAESDFLITSNLCKEQYPPLVLPNTRFSKKFTYTSSGITWNPNSPELIRNKEASKNSTLPFQGQSYPWLTIGNFLQDKIVKLPYQIDSNKFELAGANNFLLPLTPTFFQYFGVRQIPELLTIHELNAGGVEVNLKIPVRGGDITFKKIYFENDQVNIELHLAILPFVRVESFPVKYTVGLLHSESQSLVGEDLSISFLEKGVTHSPSDPVMRSRGEGTLKSIYQSFEGKFDSIKVLHKSFGEAFIIPKLQKYHQGGDSFKFAIDFGTTNTHIEYKKSGLKENVLTNSLPSTYWTSLLDTHSNPDQLYIINEKTFEQELMPLTFGQNDDGFPLRTALVENFNIDFTKPVEVFKHINNFLLYDRQLKQGHLSLHTKLKWSDYQDPVEQKRVEAYIEYLLWLIFFKVILENGDLSRTEITWFHPVSMTTFQQNVLEGKWKQLYQKVFGNFANKNQIKKVAESIAPFYYYHNRMGVLGLSVSIDVGGGSSDIAIFDHGQAEFISSFRYAGDAIFGDGYGGSPSINGFVKRFREQAKIFLENNDSDKLKILEHIIEARGDSADFSSFLFSLSAKDQLSFNYEDLIKNDQSLKLCILLFYSSLAFYVARFMKLAGYSTPPKNILFSGTGSKTLSLLDSSNFENISNLFENIFNHVFNKTESHIEIMQAPFPKEITCKGGLLTNNILNQPPVKFWIGGVNNPTVSNIVDSKNLRDVPRYNQINDGEKESIINSIIEFYELLDNYFENTRIDNVFGIKREAYEIFREMREDELIQFFEKGIEVKTKEEGNDENLPLEETLFFYPLVGVLNKLTYKLSEL